MAKREDSAGRRTGEAARTQAPLGRRAADVVANERLGAYRLIRVADLQGPPDPQPGQFYMLATAEGWGGGADERPYLPRAFSFARLHAGAPEHTAALDRGGGLDVTERDGPVLEFVLEAVGPGTRRLGRVEAGEAMDLTGPLGVGFRPPEEAGSALLVGGGIGIAPILCWSDELGPDARVLLGFRSGDHAEAAALFQREPLVATDDGSVGRPALVTELLREELDARGRRAGPSPTVYACGPPPMLEAVRAICAERDLPAQLALESGMACGYGACFGCVVPTRSGLIRLCVDGPVLDGAELETAAAGTGH